MSGMKEERDKIVNYFNKHTDLKEKVIVSGIK